MPNVLARWSLLDRSQRRLHIVRGMSGLLRQLRYLMLSSIACTLFVVIPFALTSAFAACLAQSSRGSQPGEQALGVAHAAHSSTGALAADGECDDDDFEDVLQQRLSIAELRTFAAPASMGALGACRLRGRMEDGRREKPPRSA